MAAAKSIKSEPQRLKAPGLNRDFEVEPSRLNA
jgi:hypothetical protein